MIEIFTPETNYSKESKTEENLNEEGFTDDENAFYHFIKPTLNEMIKDPKEETLSKIMNYSKSKE